MVWESRPVTRNKEDARQIGTMFQASIAGSNEAMKAAKSIIFLCMNRGLWTTLEERTNTVRKPFTSDIIGIPQITRKIRSPLVDVDKFDKFGV